MGAWGVGPFDNDAGLDFVGELRDHPSEARDRVTAPLLALTRESPAPSPPAARRRGLFRRRADAHDPILPIDEAMAAAAVIAVALGAPDDVNVDRAFVDSLLLEVDDRLRELALAALERAFVPAPENEWLELWEEAGALDEVRAALDPYRSALRG
jgi:hypothetical protein